MSKIIKGTAYLDISSTGVFDVDMEVPDDFDINNKEEVMNIISDEYSPWDIEDIIIDDYEIRDIDDLEEINNAGTSKQN